MRPKTRSLGFLVIFAGACSQIIGLNDYEKVGDEDNAAGVGTGGVRDTGGAANTGGKGGRAGTGGGSAARSGSGAEAGEIERGGAGGVPSASGGRNTGGRSTGGRDTGGEANAGGIGGAPRGGEGGTSEGGTPPVEGGAGGAGGDVGGAGGAGGGAPSTGGSPTCVVNQELLANRLFDAPDNAPWFQDSSEGRVEILTAAEMPPGLAPNSAPNSAVLGGTGLNVMDIDDDPDTVTPGGDATVGQDVTVPLGAKEISLTCVYRLVTQETDPYDYDLMAAWLYDYTHQVAALRFHTWSNQDVIDSWQKFTFSADATAVAGGTYSMEFYALVDATNNTWFGVDNCSLKVTQCN
jgi:hypothetical protein